MEHQQHPGNEAANVGAPALIPERVALFESVPLPDQVTNFSALYRFLRGLPAPDAGSQVLKWLRHHRRLDLMLKAQAGHPELIPLMYALETEAPDLPRGLAIRLRLVGRKPWDEVKKPIAAHGLLMRGVEFTFDSVTRAEGEQTITACLHDHAHELESVGLACLYRAANPQMVDCMAFGLRQLSQIPGLKHLSMGLPANATHQPTLKPAFEAMLATGKVTSLSLRGRASEIFSTVAGWIAASMPASHVSMLALVAEDRALMKADVAGMKALLAPGLALRTMWVTEQTKLPCEFGLGDAIDLFHGNHDLVAFGRGREEGPGEYLSECFIAACTRRNLGTFGGRVLEGATGLARTILESKQVTGAREVATLLGPYLDRAARQAPGGTHALISGSKAAVAHAAAAATPTSPLGDMLLEMLKIYLPRSESLRERLLFVLDNSLCLAIDEAAFAPATRRSALAKIFGVIREELLWVMEDLRQQVARHVEAPSIPQPAELDAHARAGLDAAHRVVRVWLGPGEILFDEDDVEPATCGREALFLDLARLVVEIIEEVPEPVDAALVERLCTEALVPYLERQFCEATQAIYPLLQ